MSQVNDENHSGYVVSVLPFGTTEEEFAEFAKAREYIEVRRTPEDRTALTLLTVTYFCVEPGTHVQYVYNFKIHIATARAHGPGRWAVAKALGQYFYVVDEKEIRTRLASDDPGDRGLSLAYLAEFAPSVCEPRLLDIFARGAVDADADVREFSFLAMGIVGWSQFRSIAESALVAEKVSALRAQLQRLIANLP